MKYFTLDDFVDLPVSKETNGMLSSWDAQTVADAANAKRDAEIEQLRAENARLRDDTHSCGPDCGVAACVNRRLREALQKNQQYWKCINEMGDPKYCSEWAQQADDATDSALLEGK